MDDAALLQRYARDRSEAAFGEFARRHVDLVYSAALRQVGGDPHRAREVTQVVFIGIARKAAALARHPAPLAWIFQSTRFAAANLRREEGRRRLREAAAADEWPPAEEPAADWARVRPVLDGALGELREADREAVLLRYFANQPFAEVGRRLGVNENAARMRVERALERLQGRLASRGITSASAALGAVLAANAVTAAPAGLASAAVGAALAGAAGAGGLAGAAAFMSSTKIQLCILSLVLAAGVSTAVRQARSNARVRAELSRVLQEQGAAEPPAVDIKLAALRRENLRLAQAARELRAGRQAAAGAPAAAAPGAAAGGGRAASSRTGGQAVAADRIYQLGELDQLPMPLYQPQPAYPYELKRQGSSGQAVIECVVGPDGTLSGVHAVSSSDPAFADAATAAVRKWRFQPGRKEGQQVGAVLQVPIVFRHTSDDGNPQLF
ncbi:MAG TPA: TonB family protein [Opitutaceae bacterium]|nr:TonB family protein [Opitutaceae bacterium]